jgi:hypothetical protein
MDLHAAYLERRDAELGELNAELKTLEFKANILRPTQEVQLYDDLQELRTLLGEMRHQLGELRNAASNHWDEWQEKLEATWEEFQSSLKRIQRQVD